MGMSAGKIVGVLIALLTASLACTAPEASPVPTAAPTVTPAVVASPTDTPAPTATPLPTATLAPTPTFTPTPTAAPIPPTSTPQPTNAPLPTPTATPAPTSKPAPTRTPIPTVVLPTPTPAPPSPLADLRDGNWLERNKPRSADRIKSLPWVADGVAEAERTSAVRLIATAVWWPDTFNALLSKPWLQDGITRDETTVIEYVYWITRQYRDEATRVQMSEAVVALLDMPFLETVESPDATAVWDLYKIAQFDHNDFLSIMAHPNVADGITNQEAKVVTVLSSANRYKPASLPALLDGLDGTGGVYLEERAIELDLSGDVHLTIIRVRDKDTPNMGRLEHAVRVVEEFIGEPLPTNYVAWYLDDAARSAGKGYHAGTHITSSLVYDIVDGDSKSRTPMQHIAHEVGHYYFRGNTHQWLDEGPAKFFESISERERVGRPVGYFKQYCVVSRTIAEQERLRNDIIAGRTTPPDGWTHCDYYLGERFFVDLYLAIGEDAFRPGFRSLWLKSQAEDYSDDCEGTDLSVCHVEAAFKAGASDAVAAQVDEVLDRWYGPRE